MSATYRLVRIIGEGDTTHIATFPDERPLCAGNRAIRTRRAGDGEPTCPDCRRLTGAAPAA